MGNAAVCSPAKIQLLVEGQLSDVEQCALESHLTQCSSCREALSKIDADWWCDATEFLQEDEWDSHVQALSDVNVTLDDLHSDAVGNDSLQRVLDLLQPTDDPHSLGRLGRYEIVGAVGFGGMAVVLKGFETALSRYVAVKVLAPHLASSKSARERFSREARAAAAVLHPNVIPIHCVAEFKRLPYLVMPFIAGGSLQDRLDEKAPLELEACTQIAMQIAAGIAAAHGQGIIHRDIKPGNILLEPGLERVVITDFGLARAADDASITQTGILAGTPHFMSPEQARGQCLDDRSDLFSLGSVLYVLLTGKLPFTADNSYGVLKKVVEDEPQDIGELVPGIPDWLAEIVRRLHEKQPDDRVASAQQLSQLLSQCLTALRHPDRPIPQSLRPPPRPILKWAAVGIAAAVVVVASLVIANPWKGRLPDSGIGNHDTTVLNWPEDGEWVNVTGRFVWEGEIPERLLIQPTRDRTLYPEVVPDQSLLVDGHSGGIANVFVWLTNDDSAESANIPPNGIPKTVSFQFQNGILLPRTALLRPKDSVMISNRDPIDHTIDIGGRTTSVVAAGSEFTCQLVQATPNPISISCEYHPWFQSYVIVTDFPYCALSDENGTFRIERIPRGNWRMHIWHESTGNVLKFTDVEDVIVSWPGGSRMLELERPLVDLGELRPQLKKP